ncbi:MAG: transcription antitermination protein NusB [Firmicutes bacterium]|nr:transcription antitermination protein NusB [Bacillota bacterium]
MTRTKERETIVSLLYLIEMDGEYDRFKTNQSILKKIDHVFENIQSIDKVIIDNLQNWTIDRLNYVDKAIIRYAVYELLYTNTPYEIVINEAIDLTKQYSNLDDDLAKSFNNKLLDNIKNNLKK